MSHIQRFFTAVAAIAAGFGAVAALLYLAQQYPNQTGIGFAIAAIGFLVVCLWYWTED